MNIFQTFQEYLARSSVQVPVVSFVFNLLFAACLSYLLSKVYVRYGNSLSNRKLFGRNFILITMTTMLIISIVKSSLALSLGLVGALSIIRFRAAIKEPEELSYLFIAIAIGLGFGANQGMITIIAFIVIILVMIIIKKQTHEIDGNQNLYIIVKSNSPQKVDMNEIIKILKKHCSSVNLKRFDDFTETLELTFLVEFPDFTHLVCTKTELHKLNYSLNISFLDNKGLV